MYIIKSFNNVGDSSEAARPIHRRKTAVNLLQGTDDSSVFHSLFCFKILLHWERIKIRQTLQPFPVWSHRQNLGLSSALPLKDSDTAWDSNYSHSLSPVDINTRERKQFTLNLRIRSSKKLCSLGFSSELPAAKKIVRNFSRANSSNLSLDHLTFPQNDNGVFSSTSTFHLYILLVHVNPHRRGDLLRNICLNFTALAFLGVQQRANGRWLTDQSEQAEFSFFFFLLLRHTLLLSWVTLSN